MILVTSHGTGDAYMTLAFAHAVKDCEVYIKQEHAAIGAMFPDVKSHAYTGDIWSYLRAYKSGETFNHVHPTARHGTDISRFALLGRPTTHADLWRAMLDLPVDAPMARGQYVRDTKVTDRVFVIPKARSWPNHHPEFWEHLVIALADARWNVQMIDEQMSLDEVFRACAVAEWVIGPQCGVMAILCHALFPCRKTICTPAVEGTGWIVPTTFPYAHVTTFAGEDYDVEEHRITSDYNKTVEMIVNGPNAKRLMTGGLVSSVPVPLSVGDFFDRYSILLVKWSQFDDQRKASIAREFVRYNHIVMRLPKNKESSEAFGELVVINHQIFEQSETIVPDALNGKHLNHDKIIALNKRRVELKNKINELCGSPIEIKSYYKDGEA